MGLMLECNSTRLLEQGEAHFNSPGKHPKVRLQTIEDAGRLRIPFTSGILIGIGENWEERIQSLIVLSRLSKEYNHIQEIIIQNFNPQSQTLMANKNPPTSKEFILSVSLARLILPINVSIQVPPNLNRTRIVEALTYGANDLGGISPVTLDYINPDKKWPKELELGSYLEKHNFVLQQRLPVYPEYEKYLSQSLRKIIKEQYIK